MTIRLLFFILCLFSLDIGAQKAISEQTNMNSPIGQVKPADDLLKHLMAAEKHQIEGDLTNAKIENRAVIGIALKRFADIAIEEGKYTDAVKMLNEALKYDNSASNRTNLAIAYLRQNLFDEAITEAKNAIAIDSNHIGGHYILGNIYYTKEDYESALPELERVFNEAPDFEVARALGLTYLNLKKPDQARIHFEKMQASAGKDNAELNLLIAKFYERTNYPDDAERELRNALNIDPKKPKINFYLGYLLLQNGGSERLGEAGEFFERELRTNPNDFYSLFFSGVVASSQNDHQKAIPLLQKAVKINPNSGEAYLFLGQSQVEVNDLENAEKNLRQAVTLEANGGKNTQARRTHFMLGRLLLKTGRKVEAKEELEIAGKLQQSSLDSSRNEIDRILGQVAEESESRSFDEKAAISSLTIDLAPERIEQLKKVKTFLTEVIAQTYNNLGVISVQNDRSAEAIENFSAAIEWKPDFPNLVRNLGIVSFRAGEFEKAIVSLSAHLKLHHKDILIRKMLGSSYYLTQDFKNAAETLKPIETVLSDDAELAYFYGISLAQLKRNQEAAKIFDAIAKTSRQNPGTLLYAAQGFMILGDYLRAIKELEQVVSLAPTTPKANYFIGQSYIRLNRLADGEKAFARELAINPNDTLSKYHLALTLIERKIETERAIEILQETVSLREDYADAHYQLGKIYLEKGKTQEAIQQLEKAVSADAGKDYIHYQLSIAYRKSSRKEDAARELQIYQKLKSDQRKTENPLPMGASENKVPGIYK